MITLGVRDQELKNPLYIFPPMRIKFHVKGKPPKKDGANSMWGKKSEAKNIVNLRNAASEAKENSELVEPLNSHVSLNLNIYAPEIELERMGDLDNFITGVCDGLQAADPRANIHEIIQQECEVDPRVHLLLFTDAKVLEIKAKKQGHNRPDMNYTVMIKEL